MKIHHTALGVCDTYEVVSTRPFGYEIWNIGKTMPPKDICLFAV